MKAKRKSEKSKASRGNIRKNDAYNEAFARIESAIDNGFFIEAIAIMEAILTDRLRSHLSHHNKLPRNEKFHNLIQEWKKLEEESKNLKVSINLIEFVNLWRQQRNNTIHGFVSSECDVDTFLQNAEISARMGLLLTRSVCNWHQKEIRNTKNLNC
jgi:hypothetical protein